MTAGPTARSLAWCRERGWLCTMLERWNMHAKARHDAWGFGDILACIPGVGITLLQVTTTTNMVARQNKIQHECWEDAQRWLSYAGSAVEVWGWAKRGPRGKRKLWTLKRRRLVGRKVPDEGVVRGVAESWGSHLPYIGEQACEDIAVITMEDAGITVPVRWDWLEIEEQEP